MLRRGRTRGVASRRSTVALVGIRGVAAAGGVGGGGEGGGGVGVVVESVGLTRGRGGGLVAVREVGVREEARRGCGGRRSRRRRGRLEEVSSTLVCSSSSISIGVIGERGDGAMRCGSQKGRREEGGRASERSYRSISRPGRFRSEIGQPISPRISSSSFFLY
jgi:hypothetical protein